MDDDSASSLLLEIILSRTGAKLMFADCGEKAVEIVRNTRGIDLVLMDIKMCGINGLQATSLIKQINPDLPVIAQTACVVSGDREKCQQAGCSAYIPKPIIAENLLEIINNTLNKTFTQKVIDRPYFIN